MFESETFGREIRRTQLEALRLLLNARLSELLAIQAKEEERPESNDTPVDQARTEGLLKEIEFILAAIADVNEQLNMPRQAEPTVSELVTFPESLTLEFKASARWNIKAEVVDSAIEFEWLKAVAGFMNTEGGTILIGVADDGSIVGLDSDLRIFASGKRAPLDALENWIGTKLGQALGMDVAAMARMTFEEVGDRVICRVAVERSDRPIYLHMNDAADLFVRVGNTTKKLSTAEAVSYVQSHW